MGQSPAYQFYPDKWEAHTRHLSDSAYRIYHRVLNWMWLHADNHYTAPADPIELAVLLTDQVFRVEAALKEILRPKMPLLLISDGKLLSKGLQKEAEKQEKRRAYMQKLAQHRWLRFGQKKKIPMRHASKKDAVRTQKGPLSQCSPSPSPSPKYIYTPENALQNEEKEALFDEIWPQYPKPIGMEESRSAFFEQITTRATYADMLSALRNFRHHTREWSEQYITYAPKWFGGQWRQWIHASPGHTSTATPLRESAGIQELLSRGRAAAKEKSLQNADKKE